MLEWATRERRIVISHDVTTMSRHAWERVAAGQLMAGLLEVSRAVPVGRAIEDLLLIAEYSLPGEWEGQVLYLPLR